MPSEAHVGMCSHIFVHWLPTTLGGERQTDIPKQRSQHTLTVLPHPLPLSNSAIAFRSTCNFMLMLDLQKYHKSSSECSRSLPALLRCCCGHKPLIADFYMDLTVSHLCPLMGPGSHISLVTIGSLMSFLVCHLLHPSC